MSILVGPAGSSGLGIVKGIEKTKNLGMDAEEVEFTYGVNMSNDTAKKVGELAKKLNVKLSVHAPYWINLNSDEKRKVEQSKRRIIESCERAHYLGADYIVFHPGYYGKLDKEETYQNIKKAILDIQEVIKKNKWDVKLAPETTGKINVFGSLDEILRLVKETKCFFCVDFAHMKARNKGRIDESDIFKKLKNFKKLHIHFSGITYGEKGERAHVMTEEKDIKELLYYLKKYKKNATIINESPDPFKDSLKTLKLLKR